MSPPGGATSNSVCGISVAEARASADRQHVNLNGRNPRGDDDDDGNRGEDAESDPVMVSPSSSPHRVDSPQLVGVDDEDDDTEKFVDTVQGVVDDDGSDDKRRGRLVVVASPSIRSKIPSFIATGLAQKASPLKVKSWIACALTLDGRDKITKLLQYLARLLGWWYLVYRHDKVLSSKFIGLFKSLSNSRKAFRLGRSLIELDKLQSMGLLSMGVWYIQNHLDRLEGKNTTIADRTDGHDDDGENNVVESSTTRLRPKILLRRASSNIGWGPMTTAEDVAVNNNNKSLTRSLSSLAYRRMYRPLLSRMSSAFGESATPPSTEWWMVVGSALKIVGLFGFWMGDNMNFIVGTGALDNYNLKKKDRLERRMKWQTLASENANRAYFIGAVAGLVTNAYAYQRFYKDNMVKAKQEYQEAVLPFEADPDAAHDINEYKHALQKLKCLQQKQFSLFLALLKSFVDVTVFSNNPGIDLHKKFRGKKNHEGVHCVCGLISAGTVLYNNFPAASKQQK